MTAALQPVRRFDCGRELQKQQGHTQTTGARNSALLDIDGVATRLGVNVRHIRRLVAERRIPYIKWGRRLRFDPVHVDAWLDQHRVPPAADAERR